MATEELPAARAGTLAAPEPLLASLPALQRSPSPSRRSSLTLATASLPAPSAMAEQHLTLSEKLSSPTKSQPDDEERGAGDGDGEDGEDASKGSAAVVGGAAHFPDGGTRAYLAALGGSLVLLSTFGVSNAWGAIQAEFQRNQLRDMPPSSISWIGSLHLCILFACGLPAGRVFDLGYFRYQLAFGSILWVLGMFMLSLSTQYYQFLLSYSVCMGLALGCVFAPTVSCVGSYFFKKRSLMLGWVASGAALGAVFLPIAMNRMYPTIGFGNGTRVIAALSAVLLLIANIIMRPRDLPPKKAVRTIPLLLGFLRQPSTWLGCGGAALVMLGMFIPLFYIQVFAETNGASPVIVNYSLAILNSTAFIARLCMGLVADRFGIYNTAVPIAFATGILIFAMLGATSTGGALAFCLLYGWFMGAWVTHMAPSLMSLAQDVSEIGARAGLGFLFVSVACLIGNPIAGALLSATGGYVAPCVFGGCATLVGTGLLAAVRFTQVKRRGHWRV